MLERLKETCSWYVDTIFSYYFVNMFCFFSYRQLYSVLYEINKDFKIQYKTLPKFINGIVFIVWPTKCKVYEIVKCNKNLIVIHINNVCFTN